MAEQKATSKKTATGKVSAGKTTAIKVAKANVAADTAKKIALKKTAKAATEPKKTKQITAKKTIASTVAENKAVATRVAKKADGTGRKAANKANPPSVGYSPEHRYRMIETAAYFISERHGFQGDASEHWRAAEQEIDLLLG
ncbi:MAG: DUF2934 domain-containing protein [Gallionella sp.]|jgi:hypothetical protein|nr:DUF2934 domain-containing protein [Gallionella sp.]MCK9352904.1 DUF2934 domain-containing protein [Gallionella sp.]